MGLIRGWNVWRVGQEEGGTCDSSFEGYGRRTQSSMRRVTGGRRVLSCHCPSIALLQHVRPCAHQIATKLRPSLSVRFTCTTPTLPTIQHVASESPSIAI